MLNEEATIKAQKLLKEIIEAREKGKLYDISIEELLWLANTVIEMDNRNKEHIDCCLPEHSSCAYHEHVPVEPGRLLMLSEEEEHILTAILETIQYSKEQQKYPRLTAYDIEWLATKLKETNDELSKVSNELFLLNENYASYIRQHE